LLNIFLSSCFNAQAGSLNRSQFLDFMKNHSPIGLDDLEALYNLGTPVDVTKDGCSVPLTDSLKITGDTWLYGTNKNGAQYQLQLCVYKRHVVSYMIEQLGQKDGRNIWAQMQITDNPLALKLSEDKAQEENQKPEEILKGDKLLI